MTLICWRQKHLGERHFLVPCSGWLSNPLIYVCRQGDQSPRGCIKHVRAGSHTSIKADKRFVQLTGGQIATLGDRRAARSQAEEGMEPEWGMQGGRGTQAPASCSTQSPMRTVDVFSGKCRKAGSRCPPHLPSYPPVLWLR